jgi:hypothetical protein
VTTGSLGLSEPGPLCMSPSPASVPSFLRHVLGRHASSFLVKANCVVREALPANGAHTRGLEMAGVVSLLASQTAAETTHPCKNPNSITPSPASDWRRPRPPLLRARPPGLARAETSGCAVNAGRPLAARRHQSVSHLSAARCISGRAIPRLPSCVSDFHGWAVD